jgi:hypothetical protein
MHSVDCIEGNAKSGIKFLGAIVESYNNNTDLHRQRTSKNLKGKEDSSSQMESSSVVGGIMSTLNKLSTSFAKAQM